MCGSTSGGFIPRTAGRIVVAFLEELLRQLRRVRFHRRPRGAARSHLQQRDRLARRVARFLARFHRRGRRDQGSENLPGDRRARRAAWPASLPAARGRQRSARTARPAAPASSRSSSAKFGAFIGCSNYPECRYTRPLSPAGRRQRRDRQPRSSAKIPQTGLEVTLRSGRFGPYVQLGEAVKDGEKPKRAGLPKGTAPDDVDLDRALALLSLPREIGQASRGRRADPSPASAASGPMCSTARPMPTSARTRIFSRLAATARSISSSPRKAA